MSSRARQNTRESVSNSGASSSMSPSRTSPRNRAVPVNERRPNQLNGSYGAPTSTTLPERSFQRRRQNGLLTHQSKQPTIPSSAEPDSDDEAFNSSKTPGDALPSQNAVGARVSGVDAYRAGASGSTASAATPKKAAYKAAKLHSRFLEPPDDEANPRTPGSPPPASSTSKMNTYLLFAILALLAAYILTPDSVMRRIVPGSANLPKIMPDNFEKLFSDLHGQVQKHDKRLGVVEKSTRQYSSQLELVERKLEAAHQVRQKESQAIGDWRAQSDKRMNRLEDANDRYSKRAQQAIGDLIQLAEKLPVQMPVRVQADGEYRIDPLFWKTLQGAVDASSKSQEQEGAPSPAVSWDDFYRSNEQVISKQLREIVRQTHNSKEGQESLRLVSREAFTELVHQEIEKAKAGLEKQFNDNAAGLQTEILAKVRSQEEMYERSGSWSPFRKGQKSDADGDEKVSASAVSSMIDAALERYAADRVGRTDFALRWTGGRIIPQITSGSMRPRSTLSKMLPGFLGGRSSQLLHSPAVVIHHDNAPGQCWAFAGDTAQLGIRLAKPVVVTDVSVDHLPQPVALHMNEAPKDIVVWGFIRDKHDVRRLEEYRKEQASDPEKLSDTPTPTPPTPNHIHLASVTYDATPGSRSVQNFEASEEQKALRLAIVDTQWNFLSNWGDKKRTCVYRVRVHGEVAV
ncbi:Spindle pole body protein, contains UNC-84 domain [Ceraceosorus bombacis]|uniref:Spindle pole body protein, contains UNC-84 domain n=1 Tax=Ceraceosorus bombacis TaxID=401625 RepID=A0A0P1BRQ5_9BASI|nr:Spindle pole body protein, contains UNC-84 domain [Ceraceosorus bombacis]